MSNLKRMAASGGPDAEAERYWIEYYGDGYGEQLVRDLKTRVASLAQSRFRVGTDVPIAWYPTAQLTTKNSRGQDVSVFEGLAQINDAKTNTTRTAAFHLAYDASGKLVTSKII